MSAVQRTLLKNTFQEVVQFLIQKGLHPVVYGSYALMLYSGSASVDPQDIDLAFPSREEHDSAVNCIQRERGFALVKQFEWDSDRGDLSVNTVLRSKESILFDFSFSLGDLQVDLKIPSAILLDGVTIPILSLQDLKRSYERFGHEKSGSEEKIRLIKRLIEKEMIH